LLLCESLAFLAVKFFFTRKLTENSAKNANPNHAPSETDLYLVLLQLSTYSASQESSLYSRLDHEFPKTGVRKLFLRTLNTRSSFILLQVLDLLTTLAAFRVGGFEVNPLVANLTIHFGRVGGVGLSKVIAVLLMLGVRRLWIVNLVYIGVICWNIVVVVSLAVHRH